MNKFLVFLGITSLTFLLFLGILVIVPVIGGIAGYIVSFFFPSPFILLNYLCSMEFTPWEWGATLAFIGMFFRNLNTKG